MKMCPFCREEIQDAAVKCRFCASTLQAAKPGTAYLAETNRIVTYSIDRDLLRTVKYATWCLAFLALAGVLLYLYGFHITNLPAKPDQLTYTFILDKDLFRFAKFASAVLGVFVSVGVFLYGFEIKRAAKEAKDSADTTRQARYDVGKAKDEMVADQTASRQLLQVTQDLVEDTKKQIAQLAAEVQANSLQVAADQVASRKVLSEIQVAQQNVSDMAAVIETSRQQAQDHLAQMQTLLASAKEDKVSITKIRAQLERSKKPRPKPREGKGDALYTVPQLVQFYDFPQEFDGTDQCIGLIELGGGYADSDLDSYFSRFNIPKPTVTFVSVDGAQNNPNDPAASQVTLDIQTAGAAAPGAHIIVYVAPNTAAGFLNALETVFHETTNRPSIVSIAWGAPEHTWQDEERVALNNAFEKLALAGITVLCAAGDGGVTDGLTDGAPHVDFPASSPWVLACGGTRVVRSGDEIHSETVWSDGGEGVTGGGVSRIFTRPAWQANLDTPRDPQGKYGRAIPDVAAHASVRPGYLMVLHGHETIVGGTSASTPLWAGLIARLNHGLGRNIGFLNPTLYATAALTDTFNDITQGDNGIHGVPGYSAGPGWDAASGWGSPNGAKLLEALRALNPPAH